MEVNSATERFAKPTPVLSQASQNEGPFETVTETSQIGMSTLQIKDVPPPPPPPPGDRVKFKNKSQASAPDYRVEEKETAVSLDHYLFQTLLENRRSMGYSSSPVKSGFREQEDLRLELAEWDIDPAEHVKEAPLERALFPIRTIPVDVPKKSVEQLISDFASSTELLDTGSITREELVKQISEMPDLLLEARAQYINAKKVLEFAKETLAYFENRTSSRPKVTFDTEFSNKFRFVSESSAKKVDPKVKAMEATEEATIRFNEARQKLRDYRQGLLHFIQAYDQRPLVEMIKGNDYKATVVLRGFDGELVPPKSPQFDLDGKIPLRIFNQEFWLDELENLDKSFCELISHFDQIENYLHAAVYTYENKKAEIRNLIHGHREKDALRRAHSNHQTFLQALITYLSSVDEPEDSPKHKVYDRHVGILESMKSMISVKSEAESEATDLSD